MNRVDDQPCNDNLKILFSSPSVSRLYTGVYEVQRNLAKEFSKKAIDVCIHGLRDEYTSEDINSWAPVLPNVHDVIGPKSVGYSQSYLPALRKSDASVGHIHALWSYTSYALYRWSVECDKPYLFSVNGYLDDWALANSGFKKKIALKLGFRSVLENADCIQVNSHRELAAVRSLGLKNPICMISNGVVLPDLEVKTSPPWPLESGDDERVLLYLGRIDKKKGVDLLLQAWNLVNRRGHADGWQLLLVGFNVHQTEYEKQIKDFIQEESLSAKVTCLVGQYGEQMEACYRACTAFILPSFSEGASIAVLNAWAFAKPVVVTDECGFPNATESGCAVRIEPSVASIISGIEICIEMSDSEREAMGSKGLQLVTQKYSWSVVAKQIYEVYQWMCFSDQAKPDSFID